MKILRKITNGYIVILGLSACALITGFSCFVFSTLCYANDTTREDSEFAWMGSGNTRGGGNPSFDAALFDQGDFSTGVIEHSLDINGLINSGKYANIAGITYHPARDSFWVISAGTSESSIYEYKKDGTVVSSGTVPLDARAIVYRRKDGNIYISAFPKDAISGGPGDFYKFNLSNGAVELKHKGILQNRQCGFTFANDGNIFDVLIATTEDGKVINRVREYDFDTGEKTGREFSLDTNFPKKGQYPTRVQIAGNNTDLYFFTPGASGDFIYKYNTDGDYKDKFKLMVPSSWKWNNLSFIDNNGTLLTESANLSNPKFDGFNAPFSLSFAKDMIYIHDNSNNLMYGYSVEADLDCTLALTNKFNNNNLTMDYILGSNAIKTSLDLSGFSQDESFVILTTITTEEEGIVCSQFNVFNAEDTTSSSKIGIDWR